MQHATFRQLRVFDAIVRNGSFTRAAEEMHLTQPTLSMQVKKISDSIGLPLFEHIGKKVYLTEAGRTLHTMCREVLDSAERFNMALADLKGLKQGRLQLAAVTTAEFFLPRLLGPFCNAYPGIEVSLEIYNRYQILDRLKDNADDLYVFGHPPEGIEVDAVQFLDNPMYVVAPSDHPLVGRKRITMKTIFKEPFLFREPNSGTRLALERFFAEHGHRPTVRMELGSNEAIKQGVLGGLGLAILSRYAIDNVKGLTALNVEGFPFKRHWYLLRLAGKKQSIVAQAFCTHLAEVTGAKELADWATTTKK
ncbi:MAG: LysR family transcriptional regulator [Rhodospirillales bacterium]|nr:LysR family transcriptional regulator [Rhodospirillales bacterium]MCW8860836.1 LysR family transcriptional regulator [Rhodospirillales bacterium]MCW8951668.1 LysR family transcriptional regulator [Rhodospirillales bacterium]MCW8971567.1 LysR family transcriptional regulator [Rhodospirillales bacterium]MCW9003386.1 LysR family transcriptional regulator [Rhodospirillales bacterium]